MKKSLSRNDVYTVNVLIFFVVIDMLFLFLRNGP